MTVNEQKPNDNAPKQVNTNGFNNSRGQRGSKPSNTPNKNMQQGPNIFHILLVMFFITFIINNFVFSRVSDAVLEIEYSQFINLVKAVM